MSKKYYEVVFEGSFETICGMLEGFILASDADWKWYSSKEAGIETETMTDIIKEWASMKSRLHHVIMEEDFHLKLQKACKDRPDMKYIKPEYTKSAREIKTGSIKFTAKAYAKKYADDIKAIVEAPPADIKIEKYEPVEHIVKDAEGMELYAPEHDYTFECEGIAIGGFESMIEFRRKMDDNPLIEISRMRLQF
ncbi:MAG TPA: hypothetical protein PK358_10580 [Spirochaetota bacterium]|nr:hypothetical protein [Spirochaetota bacterium]HPJ35272.1 hypothetical protein [Spirochaetota bacterium]